MKKRQAFVAAVLVLLSVCWIAQVQTSCMAQEQAKGTRATTPIDIGDRRELFVDEFLIEKRTGVDLRLHSPTPREIVLVNDAPWEGAGGAYLTVFRDGDRFRMYYTTFMSIDKDGKNVEAPKADRFVCYAESKDGIHWTKPELGLVEFNGSKKNNILFRGDSDPAVFKDANPACRPGERYKKVQGEYKKPLLAWKSPDGLSWSRLGDKPIITQGYFDTQNIAFWDPLRNQYWAYVRDFHGGIAPDAVRDIRVSTSKDFLSWTEPKQLRFVDSPDEQLYTNQVLPYPRAPHIFMGFPARYVERAWSPSHDFLPDPEHRKNRMKTSARYGTAMTEGLFMTSRDGRTWHRWGEAFIRPGIERKQNWVYGACFQGWGIVETASDDPDAPPELSFYVTDNYWRKPVRWRRYTMRLDGFVSLHAPFKQGEVLTKPLLFAGKKLTLNLSTSAAGGIRIELQDSAGKPIPGYTLADSDEIFGDTLERVVTWKGKSDVSQLAGKPVRLRFVMKDADLFSFRFQEK